LEINQGDEQWFDYR